MCDTEQHCISSQPELLAPSKSFIFSSGGIKNVFTIVSLSANTMRYANKSRRISLLILFRDSLFAHTCMKGGKIRRPKLMAGNSSAAHPKTATLSSSEIQTSASKQHTSILEKHNHFTEKDNIHEFYLPAIHPVQA